MIEQSKNIVSITMLRNLQPGDLVWVVVSDDISSEEVDAIHTVLSGAIHEEASLLVTHEGYMRSIHSASLEELFSLRDLVEGAITEYSKSSRLVEE